MTALNFALGEDIDMLRDTLIVTPTTGTISEILFEVGDQVADGARLLILEVSK